MFRNAWIEETLRAVQDASLRLELDTVSVIALGAAPVPVPFRFGIEVKDSRFICRWRLQHGQEVPVELATLVAPPNRSISSPADAYEVLGRAENGTLVRLSDVRPFPSITQFGSGAIHYQTSFGQLNFPAEGADTLDTNQYLQRLHPVTDSGGKGSSAPIRNTEPEEQLLAVIPAIELHIIQPGIETCVRHPFHGESVRLQSNCFLGEVAGGEFCLEGKEGELLVHFRRPVATGVNGVSARAIFDGVLTALGYTHGCHPWPTYLEHRVDLRVVERWIRPDANRSAGVLLPIHGKRLATSDGGKLFHAAAVFFAGTTEETATYRRALWLMREANRHDMVFEIRLTVLCSIFEGLLRTLTDTLLTPVERDLQRSKRWPLLVGRLGLPWDGVFGKAFESWEFYRHPLAHGFQERSKGTDETSFYAYSRLTAAIHILMAKRMGFVGQLDASPLESATTVQIG